MKTSLVIVTLCACAAAMVPMERRALDPEEVPISTTTMSTERVICSPTTPCAWSTFNSVNIIEVNVTNSYCTCSNETECQHFTEDYEVNVIIYRCMPPGAERITES